MAIKQLSFKVITTLANLRLTISSCESFTGGAFANVLTDVPGASLVYKGGYITYSPEMKILLGVPEDLIKNHGVVSPEVVLAMAQQTQKHLGTNFVVAFTGNAGPAIQPGVAVGFAYVAIIFNEEQLVLRLESKHMTRERFKNFAVEQVLSIIWKIIQ